MISAREAPRRLRSDASGATAIEFAILAPVLLTLIFGAMALGFAFWTRNVLQQVSSQTARCVAIDSALCAAPTVACASADAAICYFVQLAEQRGVAGVRAAQVTIDRADLRSGISFTTVSVSFPMSMLGYSFTLSAAGQFPNTG